MKAVRNVEPSTLPRRMGRRRRRLYWTVTLIAIVALAGGALGLTLYRTHRPATYRPGEEHEDITRALDAVVPEHAPAARFVDVTAQSGLDGFDSFAGARSSQLPEDMGAGAAWGDFDNDGDDDLFLVSAGGALTADPGRWAPCRLYENVGNGEFRVSERFPDTRIIGMGAAWGDYDADGAEDLVVTGYNALRLYRNRTGRFERTSAIPDLPGFWAGAVWADFDNDGDLDLYVCGYVQYEPSSGAERTAVAQYGKAVPYTLNPASFRPERNLLFRNDGHGGFDEVAGELGIANPEGRSLSALWRDFDADGWLDLYIANDISDNVLYRNARGRFEDISHPAWVADYRGAMGLAAGDWNRDGDEDLFITHWAAQENALYDSLLNDLPAGQASMAPAPGSEGASTAQGVAPALRFMDVADMRGLGQIALQHIGWGAGFADFDADGWLDLAVANGSTFEADDDAKNLRAEPSFLFWNDSGNYFHNIGAGADAFATPHVSRGLALADYDQDGDVDVIVVDHSSGVRLLRNDMQSGSWLEMRLRAKTPRSDRPVGARVTVLVGQVPLIRAVGDASYLSQHAASLHFGLGQQERVDRVTVAWRPGSVEEIQGLEPNAIWIITEGDRVARRLGPHTQQVAPVTNGDERERVVDFWRHQRAAMHAMKVDGDLAKAIGLFRRALALDPQHEDSIYYLANCLAASGDEQGALDQLSALMRLNPHSHRAFKRWGVLRAETASTQEELAAAEHALEAALHVNREETGVSTVLGEINLLRGQVDAARDHFRMVTRTNPRASHDLYLLAYTSWRGGDRSGAERLLARAAEARRADPAPKGAAREGDVKRTMHSDDTLLSGCLREWDGQTDPTHAFAPLDAYLDGKRFR